MILTKIKKNNTTTTQLKKELLLPRDNISQLNKLVQVASFKHRHQLKQSSIDRDIT